MLTIAMRTTTAAAAFEPRAKDIDSGGDFPVLLAPEEMETELELLDDDGAAGGAGVTADANFAGEDELEQVEEQEYEDDDDDSDYHPEEDDLSEVDEEDAEEYRRSLAMEMDDHADEVSDFYLHRMLAERDSIQGEDAAWVDKYVKAQRQWKEKHGSSIDEMDLDLRLAETHKLYDHHHHHHLDQQQRERDNKQLKALVEAWNGCVAPHLPLALRNQPTEFVVSLLAVGSFVVIALVVQFYVTFKPSPLDT